MDAKNKLGTASWQQIAVAVAGVCIIFSCETTIQEIIKAFTTGGSTTLALTS